MQNVHGSCSLTVITTLLSGLACSYRIIMLLPSFHLQFKSVAPHAIGYYISVASFPGSPLCARFQLGEQYQPIQRRRAQITCRLRCMLPAFCARIGFPHHTAGILQRGAPIHRARRPCPHGMCRDLMLQYIRSLMVHGGGTTRLVCTLWPVLEKA